ncbi:hypothetical protein N2152v2_001035 [Parachlorella kessleri]
MKSERAPVAAVARRAPGPGGRVPQTADPGLYGFEFAVGLPGFQGCLASRGHGPSGEYVAGVCATALCKFQYEHHHLEEALAVMETALRRIAQQLTPYTAELDARCAVMDRLRSVAQTGIQFCLGLDLEPYGSFVSGLYTPRGDLDLSIEGTATWTGEDGRMKRVAVQDMDRDMQVRFLRALASRVEAAGLSRGRIERILHARVPILKFREAASGLECDVGICAGTALFKSAVLGLLAQYDWRMGALVRLVKVWARRHQVNDSIAGTFNSFALTLMIIFHLQTRSPPVLPPLCELFAGPYSQDAPRPLERGKAPDFQLLQRAATYLSNLSREGGYGNSETLAELLTSFFAFGAALCGPEAWGHSNQVAAGVLRRARLDTWAGQLRDGQWEKAGYMCSIEDPFDRTDNCARTVRRPPDFNTIAAAFATAEARLRRMPSLQATEVALGHLFGPEITRQVGLRYLLDDPLRHSAVQWVQPVDLIMPPRLQHHISACIPRTVRLDHRRHRGSDREGVNSRRADTAQLEQEFTLLLLEAQPPPGLENGHASSTDSRDGSSNADGSTDGTDGAAASSRTNRRKQRSGKSLANQGSGLALEAFMPMPRQPLSPAMQRMWDSMAPLFEIEAAKAAAEAAREAEAEAARKAKKDAKRAARRAAAEAKQAEQKALREDLRRAREEAKAEAVAAAVAEGVSPEEVGRLVAAVEAQAAAMEAKVVASARVAGVGGAQPGGLEGQKPPGLPQRAQQKAQQQPKQAQQPSQQQQQAMPPARQALPQQHHPPPPPPRQVRQQQPQQPPPRQAQQPPQQPRQKPRQQVQPETVTARAAVEGNGQLAGAEASREAMPQRPAPPRRFGHIMKRLSPAARDQATWAASYAALPAAERVVLQRRGVASYEAYQESQRQYRQRAKQGVAAGPMPPGATSRSQGDKGGPETTTDTLTAVGANQGHSGTVVATLRRPAALAPV